MKWHKVSSAFSHKVWPHCADVHENHKHLTALFVDFTQKFQEMWKLLIDVRLYRHIYYDSHGADFHKTKSY